VVAVAVALGAAALVGGGRGTPDRAGAVRQGDVDAQVDRLQRVVRRTAER
jgi:hypothetical protein